MKIAIIGPDGSGKTSVVNFLQKKIVNSEKRYGGKKEGHFLITTSIALYLWKLSVRSRLRIVVFFVRFLIFYPFEYIENLFRFGFCWPNSTVIFDRHPVDRLVLANQILLSKKNKNQSEQIGTVDYLEYLFLFILSKFYLFFFPRVDYIFFLLPARELIFERSGGQYANLGEVEIRIKSFEKSIEQFSVKQTVRTIIIERDMGIEEIGEYILKCIGLKR